MKAMISQPTNGKTAEEIAEARERAIAVLENKGYEVANTLFTDEWYGMDKPLRFLAKSIEDISRLCFAAYFCKGWESSHRCRIEHEAAEAYGLILFEE